LVLAVHLVLQAPINEALLAPRQLHLTLLHTEAAAVVHVE
jgi:hypothetical protein